MPALNASSKPTVVVGPSTTTLNARSTVFQPGSIGGKQGGSFSMAGASPLGANNGNIISNMHSLSMMSMPRHHHHHHHHHHNRHHQQQHLGGQRRGRGRSRSRSRTNNQYGGDNSSNNTFGFYSASTTAFESTSILKKHDELPAQAIEAWNRFRATGQTD